MKTITASDGVTIAYAREPGPNPVVLVHGFGSTSWQTWEASGIVRAFADAGRGSVLVDLRGHGESGKPHTSESYTLAFMSRDLIHVLDTEKIAAADIVGFSLGAHIARVFADHHPERVRRMVLVGARARPQFTARTARDVRKALLYGALVDDPVASALVRSLAPSNTIDRRALAACIGGLAGQTVYSRSGAPTLVAVGTNDEVAQDAGRLAEALEATFIEIPEHGHQDTLNSATFTNSLIDFLSSAK